MGNGQWRISPRPENIYGGFSIYPFCHGPPPKKLVLFNTLTVDGRNPFRTTLKPWEATICWCLQGNHHPKLCWVVRNGFRPSTVSPPPPKIIWRSLHLPMLPWPTPQKAGSLQLKIWWFSVSNFEFRDIAPLHYCPISQRHIPRKRGKIAGFSQKACDFPGRCECQ